eukprot:TRINITY_DN1515_c0_g1_i4.p1 TRINITY_DN1515_c0_g1~~TRINITY_DN1515_c0_g1_i4.p1  ORF type:complete len:579 (+),score=70.70 TRINITY_DN1515_c0_g1_i4:583-2319(+)
MNSQINTYDLTTFQLKYTQALPRISNQIVHSVVESRSEITPAPVERKYNSHVVSVSVVGSESYFEYDFLHHHWRDAPEAPKIPTMNCTTSRHIIVYQNLPILPVLRYQLVGIIYVSVDLDRNLGYFQKTVEFESEGLRWNQVQVLGRTKIAFPCDDGLIKIYDLYKEEWTLLNSNVVSDRRIFLLNEDMFGIEGQTSVLVYRIGDHGVYPVSKLNKPAAVGSFVSMKLFRRGEEQYIVALGKESFMEGLLSTGLVTHHGYFAGDYYSRLFVIRDKVFIMWMYARHLQEITTSGKIPNHPPPENGQNFLSEITWGPTSRLLCGDANSIHFLDPYVVIFGASGDALCFWVLDHEWKVVNHAVTDVCMMGNVIEVVYSDEKCFVFFTNNNILRAEFATKNIKYKRVRSVSHLRGSSFLLIEHGVSPTILIMDVSNWFEGEKLNVQHSQLLMGCTDFFALGDELLLCTSDKKAVTIQRADYVNPTGLWDHKMDFSESYAYCCGNKVILGSRSSGKLYTGNIVPYTKNSSFPGLEISSPQGITVGSSPNVVYFKKHNKILLLSKQLHIIDTKNHSVLQMMVTE